MTDFELFQAIARRRRATRHFDTKPLPDGIMDRLLDCSRWAPSGYNLQPTHFVVVSDKELKRRLQHACLGQAQVLQAPATVVFAADRGAPKHHLNQVIQLDREAGAIDDQYESMLRNYVGLAFGTGPMGLGWIAKAIAGPLLSMIKPTPSIPAIHKRYWLAKQAMLSAMNFMLAATAAGLATCPMEGFDERRVRRLLGIPRSHIVPVIVPVGYAKDDSATKTRLPAGKLTHENSW